ncbi:MAG TPA: endonuclease/exonuclease/phosphatase family protein [Lacipirellulaceae bacterium]|nr:endonuclease/exonuclease/phosphatase family protein [Lacipirellulaceae bacterium]
MTYNLRFATAPDGDNRWELRRPLALRVIREFDPDILGVQEALREQIDAIRDEFPALGCIGVGREANGDGEYSAIFFRRGRFDVRSADTFWLSDDPETPGSRSWGNELPRICTWIYLIDRSVNHSFAVLNTHWDHQSQNARFKSGELMARRVSAFVAADVPTLVIGDFNAAPDNPAVARLTQDGELLKDTLLMHDPGERGQGTFHAFTGNAGIAKIDAVLASRHWEVSSAKIVRTREGDRYPSDHFPVVAVVALSSPESAPDASP